MKNNMKMSKGITLIALVVTIIVLLLLAGISIQMLSGNNGILSRAAEAKEKTEQGQRQEIKKIAAMEAATNIEDTIFQGVTIPAGYAPTKIEGESSLDEGLVITDAYGNEFVWIEVPKSVTASATTDDEIYTALRNYCATDTSGNALITSTEWVSDTWYEGCGLDQDEYNTIKSTMLNSLKNNGGFYIGKYETGIESTYRTSAKGEEYWNNDEEYPTTETAVIKPNAYPYNYVTCSQAENLAKGFGTNGRTASLLFGIQWDLVIKFLSVKGEATNLLTSNSTTWGNYSDNDSTNGTFSITSEYAMSSSDYGESFSAISKDTVKSGIMLLTTGASTGLAKQNIYNLAGNVMELTLERASSSYEPCVVRGGYYGSTGEDGPVSFRYNFIKTFSDEGVGFRVSLY